MTKGLATVRYETGLKDETLGYSRLSSRLQLKYTGQAAVKYLHGNPSKELI